jgi:hypothetical protein
MNLLLGGTLILDGNITKNKLCTVTGSILRILIQLPGPSSFFLFDRIVDICVMEVFCTHFE